jgi:hypothetical protein
MSEILITSGAIETNPLPEGYLDNASRGSISLAEVAQRGGRITRVRLLLERMPQGRVADISYVHANIAGERYNVRTDVPYMIPANRVKAELIEWAKREGVYAKALGLLDESNWSKLY